MRGCDGERQHEWECMREREAICEGWGEGRGGGEGGGEGER